MTTASIHKSSAGTRNLSKVKAMLDYVKSGHVLINMTERFIPFFGADARSCKR